MTRLPLVHVVLPGGIETPTGGFVYDKHVVAALRDAGRLGRVIELPDRFPFPPPTTLAAAADHLRALPEAGPLLVDGLCLAPLQDVLADSAARRPLIALIHHPLADETGLTIAQRTELLAAEQRALAMVHGVIVTSETTAIGLGELGVRPQRIRVVRPGVDARTRARPVRGFVPKERPMRILCVASLTPRKGHEVLLRALRRVADRSWQVLLVGPQRDRACARRVRRLVLGLGLQSRVRLAGPVPGSMLRALYADADLFVLASFHEGYGMALAEAAAAGVPIIACRAGAVAEAVPPAACLVPPGDVPALARALSMALRGRTPRVRAGTSIAGRARPWSAMRAEIVEAVNALVSS